MAEAGALTAAVIGAGQRGRFTYGGQALAHPERLRIVAVAEPDAARRDAMAREHGLGAEALFADWRELLARPQLADAAVVATSDTLHVAPALAALARGYHVLLEKPIAPEPADCERVVGAAERAGRILQIGHVLRYTRLLPRVHEIVASGRLGRRLADRAGGARRRLAHGALLRARPLPQSRGRGADPAREELSRPRSAGLARAGAARARVASFGRLSGYTAARAPRGAPERCTQGCPVQASCAHDAVRFYLGPDDARRSRLAVERRVSAIPRAKRAAARSRPAPTGAASTAATTTCSITSWSRSSSRTA